MSTNTLQGTGWVLLLVLLPLASTGCNNLSDVAATAPADQDAGHDGGADTSHEEDVGEDIALCEPTHEVCDGVDNDCDDNIDEFGPSLEDGCADSPPNMVFAGCNGGECEFACQPGFIRDNGATNAEGCCQNNGCGGCRQLPARPGDACGNCGQWSCAGTNDLSCAEGAGNLCEGCLPLEGQPGDSCGECGRLVCAGGDTLICNDEGDVNLCGGCEELEAQPQTPCEDCGEWTCTEAGGIECVPNENLYQECQVGGCIGDWQCRRSDNFLYCSTTQNECGGCLEPPVGATLGNPCGNCGTWVCGAGNNLECDDPESNMCGGCDELPQPGSFCGECGLYTNTCQGNNALRCADVGESCGNCRKVVCAEDIPTCTAVPVCPPGFTCESHNGRDLCECSTEPCGCPMITGDGGSVSFCSPGEFCCDTGCQDSPANCNLP